VFPPTSKELLWAAIGAAALYFVLKRKAGKSS
jgi:hypothetical protein